MSINDNVYETDKYVQEYLGFHFGQDEADYMPYQDAPNACKNFNQRIADFCGKLSVSDASKPRRALDLGCAVGAASFEMARRFDEVVGVDFSQAFVDCADKLRDGGSLPYDRLDEGGTYSKHVATLPAGIDAKKCTFRQADACNLPEDMGAFDVVLMANLLCRLPTPKTCLARLGGPNALVQPGGHVVLTSPFSWLEQFTDKENWMGGTAEQSSRDALVEFMEANGEFKLVEEGSMPFLIREHSRKFQVVFPHLSVFQRKA